MTWRTIWGANSAARALVTVRIRVIRFPIDEASCQAPDRSSVVKAPVKVGMNADAKAPPATRLNNRSGNRAAALKASISALVPNACETRIWRIRPVMLLRTNAAITVPAARAIWRLAVPRVSLTRCDYIRASSAMSDVPFHNSSALS